MLEKSGLLNTLSFRKSAISLCLGLIFLVQITAAHADNDTDHLEYPELVVTPRATERVQSEAVKEKSNRYTRHIPIQVSALTTLTAALMQTAKNKNEDDGKSLGMLIGGGWIAATIALSATYTPYLSGYQEYARLPSKTPREQLARERLAEETLDEASTLGSRLAWLSFASNLTASGYLLAKVEKGTTSMAVDIAAFVGAFTPLLFKSRWQDIANDQQLYKKRIYGPIASATLIKDSQSQKYMPALALQMNF